LLLAVVLTCLGVVMVFSSSSIMAVREHGDSLYSSAQGCMPGRLHPDGG